MRPKGFCILFSLMLLLSVVQPVQSNNSETVSVPIIMYHSLSDRSSSDWILSPSEFERDLKFLEENDYHTVFISELIDYVCEGKELPEKPVVLTFDDGYFNNYRYAMPMIKEYDMKIVLSIVGKSTDDFSAYPDESDELNAHVTWEQIKEMSESGYVEFGNHTQNLHLQCNGRKGCVKVFGEDKESYKWLLIEDVMTLQAHFDENCGFRPVCFTYPYGSICSEAEDIIKELGFKASLSVKGGAAELCKDDPECLYKMRRNNRSPHMSVEKILGNLA